MVGFAAYQWDFTVVNDWIPQLGRGLLFTIAIAIVTMALSLPTALVLALLRIKSIWPTRVFAYGLVEGLRTVPLLVLIIWLFYVLPIYTPVKASPLVIGTLALTLNVSAILAEVFRGAITSIDRGQWDAAFSSGMTRGVALRRVILPQAARRSLPLVAATWVSLFRDSALLAVIGVHELMNEAQTAAVISYRPLELFTVVSVMYFVLTYPQAVIVERLFQRVRVAG